MAGLQERPQSPFSNFSRGTAPGQFGRNACAQGTWQNMLNCDANVEPDSKLAKEGPHSGPKKRQIHEFLDFMHFCSGNKNLKFSFFGPDSFPNQRELPNGGGGFSICLFVFCQAPLIWWFGLVAWAFAPLLEEGKWENSQPKHPSKPGLLIVSQDVAPHPGGGA